jgi:hypothetical protein
MVFRTPAENFSTNNLCFAIVWFGRRKAYCSFMDVTHIQYSNVGLELEDEDTNG